MDMRHQHSAELSLSTEPVLTAKFFRIFALLLLLLSLGACASGNKQERQLMRNQLTRIDDRVAKLIKYNQTQTELISNITQFRRSILTMTGQVEEFNERVRMLSERMESMEKSFAEMSKVYRGEILEQSAATNLKLAQLQSDLHAFALETRAFISLIEKKNNITSRAHRGAMETILNEEKAGEMSAGNRYPGEVSPASEGMEPDDLYQRSYNSYLQADFENAITGFKDYLRLYPKTSLSDNAAYWVGESLYSLKNFQEAATAFDKVSGDYANSVKAPASLLRSGFALIELGEIDQARERFQKIVDAYPTSNEAIQAADRLSSMSDNVGVGSTRE